MLPIPWWNDLPKVVQLRITQYTLRVVEFGLIAGFTWLKSKGWGIFDPGTATQPSTGTVDIATWVTGAVFAGAVSTDHLLHRAQDTEKRKAPAGELYVGEAARKAAKAKPDQTGG